MPALWGLPGLTGYDSIRLRAVNKLIRLICRVADNCFVHDVCVCVCVCVCLRVLLYEESHHK